LDNLDEIEFLLNFYDRILIHTPPRLELDYASEFIEDVRIRSRYKSVFNKFRKKIIFTGYITPLHSKEMGVMNKLFRDKRGLVLVTRGAGAYYPRIISCAISAKIRFGDLNFLVVSGPASTAKEWEAFVRLKQRYNLKNIFLAKYIPDLWRYYKIADVVVSTAAYNSSVALLYHKKKSVIIPFTGYAQKNKFWEQPVRARLLKDYLGSSVVDYSQLTPELLSERISEQLEQPAKPWRRPKASWFEGNCNTAGKIASLR